MKKNEQMYQSIVNQAYELFEMKNKDYGNAFKQYGAKGLFILMAGKIKRLEQLLWKNEEPQVKNESIEDTLLDLVNYAIMTLICIRENNWDGSENE